MTGFSDVHARLRTIMASHADHLVVVRDAPGDYYLDTPHVMKNGKPLFFGAVKINRRYVSYHLMPVYVCPDMKKEMSKALGARMQGKSCFNFRDADDGLFTELAALTRAGLERYREAGYLGPA